MQNSTSDKDNTNDNTQLITVDQANTMQLFTSENQLLILLDEIKTKANIVPDVHSNEGRKEISSMAYRVARTKTYLDALGKDLVTELKALPKSIDAKRKMMRDRLDVLKDEIMQPLEHWEAEQERLKTEKEIIEIWDFAHKENKLFDIQKEERAKAEAEIKRRELEAIKEEQRIIAERNAAQAVERAKAEAEIKAMRQQLEAEQALKRQQEEHERSLNLSKAIQAMEIKKAQEQHKRELAKAEELKRFEIEKQKRLEAEQKRKSENEEHQKAIHQDLIGSLIIVTDITADQAQTIITAIKKGDIDHLQIVY